MDRTSQGRYWSEDADNYRRIIEAEFNSFRADAWLQLFPEFVSLEPLKSF